MGVSAPGILYSPFTAADEKIPLSIGQVNCKPQYLVFSSHLQHCVTKLGHLACGKRKGPTVDAVFVVQDWPGTRQRRVDVHPGHFLSLCSPEDEVQGLKPVQIRSEIVRILDIYSVSMTF